MTQATDTTPKQQARAALANTIIQKLAKRNMEGYYCPFSKFFLLSQQNLQ